MQLYGNAALKTANMKTTSQLLHVDIHDTLAPNSELALNILIVKADT